MLVAQNHVYTCWPLRRRLGLKKPYVRMDERLHINYHDPRRNITFPGDMCSRKNSLSQDGFLY